MNTPFLEPFKLIIDPEHESDDLIEDGLNSMGLLATLAQECANVAAIYQGGSTPNQQMITQLNYTASVLSGLVAVISDLLSSLDQVYEK